MVAGGDLWFCSGFTRMRFVCSPLYSLKGRRNLCSVERRSDWLKSPRSLKANRLKPWMTSQEGTLSVHMSGTCPLCARHYEESWGYSGNQRDKVMALVVLCSTSTGDDVCRCNKATVRGLDGEGDHAQWPSWCPPQCWRQPCVLRVGDKPGKEDCKIYLCLP